MEIRVYRVQCSAGCFHGPAIPNPMLCFSLGDSDGPECVAENVRRQGPA